ncbi:MAG: mRNA interferase RelE/StbE [Candidatus Diapherotrites archaeon]|nr:mRNA interferase RelE/StbE [Candidatus Diapherotrites archaeon]MDN5366818.1 mRNA interferase RelE/StbE [Candidatus Diapherotrites archaeon]
MSWRVLFHRKAKAVVTKLQERDKHRILDGIKVLVESIQRGTPTDLDIKKLKGKWAGFYRLRVGKWRVIFRVDWENRVLLVYNIAKRENVYE